MYCDCISKFQFIQLFKRILHIPVFFKNNRQCLCKGIDFFYDTHITIENTDSFIHSDTVLPTDFPLQLVVIPDLHDFIALSKQSFSGFFFFLFRILWIQIFLQNLV